MSNTYHDEMTGPDLHVIQNFTYANAVELASATGFVASDVGKVAFQTDTKTFWILIDYTTPKWKQLTLIAEDIEMPIGSIVAFAGSTPPVGWLLCDGSSVAVATYPFLHSVVGYAFGGSGANFNLPDLQGRVALGAGAGAGLTSRSVADQGGQEKITSVPEHNHSIDIDTVGADQTDPSAGSGFGTPASAIYDSTPNSTSSNYVNNSGTAGGVDVMNPFTAVNYIIKAA